MTTTIECGRCGTEVQAQRATRKWCDDCAYRPWKDATPERAVTCRWCTTEFTVPRGDTALRGRRYCSPEHALLAARKSRVDSARRRANGEKRRAGGRPRVLTDQERAQRKREGITARFFRTFPERPRVCEACGESRVVELAHKVARAGAWRTFANTGSDDVWVLCPTCHRVLDGGIQTAQELGIS